MTRAEHAALCDEVKRLISLGELFEVNLAHVLDAPWEHDGFELFERLAAVEPGDHSAYLEAGDGVDRVDLAGAVPAHRGRPLRDAADQGHAPARRDAGGGCRARRRAARLA